jgi:hypothetical protein
VTSARSDTAVLRTESVASSLTLWRALSSVVDTALLSLSSGKNKSDSDRSLTTQTKQHYYAAHAMQCRVPAFFLGKIEVVVVLAFPCTGCCRPKQKQACITYLVATYLTARPYGPWRSSPGQWNPGCPQSQRSGNFHLIPALLSCCCMLPMHPYPCRLLACLSRRVEAWCH